MLSSQNAYLGYMVLSIISCVRTCFMKNSVLIFLLSSSIASAQGLLKGTVREAGSNQPLTGASIILKGTALGTVAQTDGAFSLAHVASGNYEVEVSFLGCVTETQTAEIKDKSSLTLDFYLDQGSIQLADVMISSSADRPINTLSSIDIKLRPTNTSQDILRMVPGLFIAQHAGGGKAEQIFLRGFDIDHGTDINLEVDGLPVNMVSHAHGQGYSDLHFLIPELVQFVDFGKGPYFADKGDFATAGYVDFQTRSSLEKNFAKIEGGKFGAFRGVAGVNFIPRRSTNQTGYIASEFFRSNGYFESPQNFKRFNITGKYTNQLSTSDKLILGASFFNSGWDASGQVPERAVNSGQITRFGSLDNTEGGKTQRINMHVKHIHQFEGGATFDHQAYAVHYNFNLYSNFTFYLNDPVNGDQIQQKESRMIYGYKANYNAFSILFGKELKSHMGGGVRHDDVKDISLSNTIKRQYRSDVQRGDLAESNVNVFISETLMLSERWSLNAALRFDHFTFAYDNKIFGEYKSENSSIVSPKLNINYKVNDNTQVYVRTGTGFHSNDTRVVVEQNAKEILPRAYGIDFGMDTKLFDNVMIHAALWRLDLEQEFVYVGDAGIVEPSGKTQRQGIDLSIRYQVLSWLFADTDVTLADPKAKGEVDDNIPLAPTFSSIGGLTFRVKNGLNGSLRYRYLDDRAANENNSVVAKGYFLMDGVVNYTKPKFEVGMSMENILNTEWKEAQFNTESRMFDETQPVSEIHFTPGSPFFAKLHVSFFF